jgi:hypothetical protein
MDRLSMEFTQVKYLDRRPENEASHDRRFNVDCAPNQIMARTTSMTASS